MLSPLSAFWALRRHTILWINVLVPGLDVLLLRTRNSEPCVHAVRGNLWRTAQTPEPPTDYRCRPHCLLAHDLSASRDFYRTFLGFEEP